MPVFASLLAFSLALAGMPAHDAPAPPRRVASLNLCTDELLLLIAAPEQIASVTHLAQQEAETPLWRHARLYPRNDGSLMSVTRFRPDLVVTMGGGGRDRQRIAGRLGIATLDLPYPAGIPDLEASIARLAEALGRRAVGETVLARIAELKRRAPPARTDAIWLGGGGRTIAPGGIEAQWMALAGLRQRPLPGDRVPLETLIARPPAVLLRSDYRAGDYSRSQRWLAHPAARRARAGRTLTTDGRLWTCMGPQLVDEIHRLRRELAR